MRCLAPPAWDLMPVWVRFLCAGIASRTISSAPTTLCSRSLPCSGCSHESTLQLEPTQCLVQALWFANCANTLLWWTYVKACNRALSTLLGLSSITFKTTLKVIHQLLT